MERRFKLFASRPSFVPVYAQIPFLSVTPVMMAQVASRIYDQWLSKIRK